MDFTNALIIMTSNIGSQYIQDLSGEGQREQMEEAVMGALHSHFKPEFLNRVDNVVIFHALTLEQIKAIVGIQAKRINKLLTQRGIALEISDAAQSHLAQVGFDPVYGARPLKRALQTQVMDPLAVKLLDGTFGDGDTIVADVENDKVVFSKR